MFFSFYYHLGLGFWDLSSPVFHEKSKNTIIGKSATYIGQDWIGLIFSLHEKKAHCGSEWVWPDLASANHKTHCCKKSFSVFFFLLRCNTQRKFLCSLHSFQRKSEILHLWNAKLFHHWVLYFAQTRKKRKQYTFCVTVFFSECHIRIHCW